MKHLFPFTALCLVAVASSAAQKNILLIIADDYGAGSSRLYNSSTTMNLNSGRP